jgi:hypothetical protein
MPGQFCRRHRQIPRRFLAVTVCLHSFLGKRGGEVCPLFFREEGSGAFQYLFNLDGQGAGAFEVGGAGAPRAILWSLDGFRAAAVERSVVRVAILTIEAECKRAIRRRSV